MKPIDINADEVFANLKRKRENGTLAKDIADGNVRYQVSKIHPGMLEKILPDGNIQTGKFVDGTFKRIDDV